MCSQHWTKRTALENFLTWARNAAGILQKLEHQHSICYPNGELEYPATCLPGSSTPTGIRSEHQTLHEPNISYFSLAGSRGLPTGGATESSYVNTPIYQNQNGEQISRLNPVRIWTRLPNPPTNHACESRACHLLLALLSDADGNAPVCTPRPDTDWELISGSYGSWTEMTATGAASTDSGKGRGDPGMHCSGDSGARGGWLSGCSCDSKEWRIRDAARSPPRCMWRSSQPGFGFLS